MSNFKAAFFDLDGLLADTEDLHIMAYKAVTEYLGIVLDKEYIRSLIGVSTRDNVRSVMRDYGIPDHRYDEILSLRYSTYLDIVKSTPLMPMDGALECVWKAKERGKKLALVTSAMKEHAIAVLEKISNHSAYRSAAEKKGSLLDLFDAMVFGSEIRHLKPEPDIYLEALRRLKTSAGECIAFEDSESGVIAAKRAGLYTVAVPNVHTKDQNFDMADLKASSLRDSAISALFQ